MSKDIHPRVWLVDFSPAHDVQGSGLVSGSSEAALEAEKIFAPPVSSADVAAAWAGLACVGGVHEADGDSDEPRFILDEASKLTETPGVQVATLRLANRCPRANSLQIFKGYPSLGVFRLRNQPLADHVVHVPSEARLFSAPPLEESFARFCSLTLKPSFEPSVATPQPVQMPATPDFSIAVHGDVFDAEIHAKIVLSLEGGRLRCIYRRGQVEGSVAVEEVCLSSDSVCSRLLICTYLNRYYFAPFQRQKGDGFQPLPVEDALIVDHGTIRPEAWLDGLVSLVGFAHLGYRPYRHLSGEAELLSYRIVDEGLEPHLVRCMLLEGYGCDVVAGLIEAGNGFFEGFNLFLGGS